MESNVVEKPERKKTGRPRIHPILVRRKTRGRPLIGEEELLKNRKLSVIRYNTKIRLTNALNKKLVAEFKKLVG